MARCSNSEENSSIGLSVEGGVPARMSRNSVLVRFTTTTIDRVTRVPMVGGGRSERRISEV